MSFPPLEEQICFMLAAVLIEWWFGLCSLPHRPPAPPPTQVKGSKKMMSPFFSSFPSSDIPSLTGTPKVPKQLFRTVMRRPARMLMGRVCAHVSFDSRASISAAPVVMETVERHACMCVSGRPSNPGLFRAPLPASFNKHQPDAEGRLADAAASMSRS